MSPLWRAAAAAAARRGIGRTPSVATTTMMLGRRTMYSSSCRASGCNMGFLKLAALLGIIIVMDLKITGIREEMKTLQASNDEILALLKKDGTRTGE